MIGFNIIKEEFKAGIALGYLCSLLLISSVSVVSVSLISCSDEKLLARIGDEKITEQKLDEALQEFPERRRNSVAFRARILDNIIQTRVFSNEARKAGLENEPGIKADLEKIENQELSRYFIRMHVDEQAKPEKKETE